MYQDRPDTVSGRMRHTVLILDFYDEIARAYTLPLMKDYISRNPNMPVHTYNYMMQAIDVLEESIYPISESRAMQEDLEDDADEVERIQEFYERLIRSWEENQWFLGR
jgi:hypothetical protein